MESREHDVPLCAAVLGYAGRSKVIALFERRSAERGFLLHGTAGTSKSNSSMIGTLTMFHRRWAIAGATRWCPAEGTSLGLLLWDFEDVSPPPGRRLRQPMVPRRGVFGGDYGVFGGAVAVYQSLCGGWI